MSEARKNSEAYLSAAILFFGIALIGVIVTLRSPKKLVPAVEGTDPSPSAMNADTAGLEDTPLESPDVAATLANSPAPAHENADATRRP